MAPRGSQPSSFKTKQRQKRISDLKARIAALEKQTSGKGGFRNKNRISQLKKKLRDMNAGYQKVKPTNTEKKTVKTSRGLKIRNVAKKPKRKYNDGKMSNIPAGEATVNNPNFGKPGDFKPKESKAKTNELKDKTVDETISKDNKDTKDNKDKKVVSNKKENKDPLAPYRRGKGTKLGKDTRITKKLKKSGFTEDRLAKLRKKNAAFQKAKKGGKEAMKKYREIYG